MNYVNEIDQISAEFEKLFGSLSYEELNLRPGTDVWSIGQNIHHLIIVNESYFPVFEALKAQTYSPPFMANFGLIVRFFGKLVLKAVHQDRKKKMNTFPVWEPNATNVSEHIVEQFIAHQERLKKYIEELQSFVVKGIVIVSPASNKIVYKLEVAFEIIITHEKRHLEQAKEVLVRKRV